MLGERPAAGRGSPFAPELRSSIRLQAYPQPVPQRLRLEALGECGVPISSGQLNRLLTAGQAQFHEERAEILGVGLAVSAYSTVADTAARPQGQSGGGTQIGNELFAGFARTASTSRLNFLELLCAGHTDSVLDAGARE